MLLEPGFQIWHRTVFGVDNAKMARRMPIQELKWSATEGGVVGGIIPKLGKGWPFALALRTRMHNTVKKSFQTLIKMFGLAIRLGVIRRAHKQFSIREPEQLFPKSAC